MLVSNLYFVQSDIFEKLIFYSMKTAKILVYANIALSDLKQIIH